MGNVSCLFSFVLIVPLETVPVVTMQLCDTLRVLGLSPVFQTHRGRAWKQTTWRSSSTSAHPDLTFRLDHPARLAVLRGPR